MATFPYPSEIQNVYLQMLKSIKPSLNINDPNSDFVIRARVISGLLSGVYGDQAKINADTFVSTARPEALILKGKDLGLSLNVATQSASTKVTLTGPTGLVVNAGDIQFLYPSTGLFYVNTTGGTFANGTLDVSVQAQVTGSLGNITAPDVLNVINPPSGVSAQASLVYSAGGGSDVETYDSFRARILARQQYTPSGGNQADYQSWAYLADPSVRSVSIRRFIKGLGTVGVVITSGVTDIDSAVTNGVAVVRTPSMQVIQNVQSYYDTHAPLTDCVTVFGPTETAVNVTVNVALMMGLTLNSVPSDSVNNPLGLNIQALIEREVGRVLYKYPIGGRRVSTSGQGAIIAADIESALDTWLGPMGKMSVLFDRQVMPLNPPNFDIPIDQNSLAAPGTVTVNLGLT
jgi:uncharacterized phage protein gp47/JayE